MCHVVLSQQQVLVPDVRYRHGLCLALQQGASQRRPRDHRDPHVGRALRLTTRTIRGLQRQRKGEQVVAAERAARCFRRLRCRSDQGPERDQNGANGRGHGHALELLEFQPAQPQLPTRAVPSRIRRQRSREGQHHRQPQRLRSLRACRPDRS